MITSTNNSEESCRGSKVSWAARPNTKSQHDYLPIQNIKSVTLVMGTMLKSEKPTKHIFLDGRYH